MLTLNTRLGICLNDPTVESYARRAHGLCGTDVQFETLPFPRRDKRFQHRNGVYTIKVIRSFVGRQ